MLNARDNRKSQFLMRLPASINLFMSQLRTSVFSLVKYSAILLSEQNDAGQIESAVGQLGISVNCMFDLSVIVVCIARE